ncbi:VOC family protein [Winogradskyella ouciana]|uniref:VOC family protein n=1 Tax=Winogradskyella ouciana TaxID=2608631 RepID=A0A7K1GDS9_9FLAO|nr:VOC family protein [Winogradskyella ouciana]MTE27293.1 VOC family protein [Winogradskyella ouciana]
MKKLIALLVLILSSGFVSGQDKNEISVNFNHIALSVKDSDESAEFYKNVLNLNEITNRTIIEGIRWLSLGEGKELHLISILKDEIKTNKAVHLALTTSDFDLLIAKLKSMKVEYSDWPGNVNKINVRADGIKQVFFQDPNGYWIEVNSVAESND